MELCFVCNEVEKMINQPVLQSGGGFKRRSAVLQDSEDNDTSTKRGRQGEPSTSSGLTSVNDEMVNCSLCQILIRKRYYANHLRSNLHKNNVMQLHSTLKNVTVHESAFGNRIISYKIKSKSNQLQTFETPEMFLNSIKNEIISLFEESVRLLTIFKVNFILHANFVQETKNISNEFEFQTCSYTIMQGEDLNFFFSSLCDMLMTKISTFEKKDSGWSLKKINALDMNINKFNPLRGKSYIELPKEIKLKKSVINVQNSDDLCFKWALLSALYPVTKNSQRVSSYSKYSNKLNFDGVTFPVKMTDIQKVERLNNLSVNVFGLEYNCKKKVHELVGPLYLTKSRKIVHINLLFISHGTINHFCYIKNLSRLVSGQISNHEHAIYICDGCLLHFSTNDKLSAHQLNDCCHIKVELPSTEKTLKDWFGQPISNNVLKFDKFNKMLQIPFVIYADFEAFLNPIQTCFNDPSKPYTTNVHKHEVYSFGYYIKCSYDDSLSKYETYSGPHCTHVFMNQLYKDLEVICTKNSFVISPKPLTSNDNEIISQCKDCFICQFNLNGECALYFDSHTGHFRGVAHEVCKTKFRIPYHIPVFLHNLSQYDSHFIVHALNSIEGEIDIIPQTKEKYISFTKTIKFNNHKIQLRFVDSFKFLPCSLDKLVQNLMEEQFQTLKYNFPNNNDFLRLRKKGIYPYEFMSSHDSLKLSALPSRDKFYNTLTDTHISDEDYEHAKDVWQHFHCQNMSDYSDLYLKTDVLLLTDVFENFRALCLQTYGLDPAHYYTAPGLSWDAMLKCTKIKLELLQDFEQIAFIRSGIRGGVSQCSNRYAKANNKYMREYDKDTPNSFLTYLDANNLYGWAMSQFLPTGGFEWVDVTTNFDVPDDYEYGFILEVDLEYPIELHDLHSDLPLCPENICIGNTKDIKLVPNLRNKIKYVIHYRNLKQCLTMGLKLQKIHRILKFKQCAWLQYYIDLNTNMRKLATSDFEKDFYKLMNNSVFGKTMENIEKRVNVKLLSHWENQGKILGAQDLIAKPEFHSSSIFNENLVAVQLRKTKLFHNKPIYLGFCILDISKTLMYDFHYNYMFKKFQNKLKLLYTDTDSLIYQIFTDDFYRDIKPDLHLRFDTSDYTEKNIFGYPKLNKKKLGYFKDENNGNIFNEFVGLRSKMYALDVEGKFTAKAKGVNKSVTKNMKMENYKTCLFENKNEYCSMLRFKSIKHNIFTQRINKSSLSFNDTKRYILPNNIDTLAWGHHKIE
ncbi:uncharacterized protein LOC126974058 isoform X2 [Leptidea sinapis]|uniref:uncharacterized protein LOC126974058 isoform X2 n=1 Tax=Leptidea sinapis TaxID=189913 RepID=UPI0021C48658|nr:uncharacterized protein LOC126974058 isoform X2 [Leptidea sinapis]